jgi:hypothetical protein
VVRIAERRVSEASIELALITAHMLSRYVGEKLRSEILHLLGDN